MRQVIPGTQGVTPGPGINESNMTLSWAGLANVNLTINRKFHLKERAELQFLAEATNAFNRTNFIPSAVSGGYSAVTVADPTTNTKVGQNASIGTGSLGPQFLSPRQITLSLRLQF
jgi:hypothetical protein